jgi:broad specificity phosphatase PhoE
MPDHLIVIRSPATDYEQQGRVRGSLDVPPCPEGLAEARAVAATLAAAPPEAIYTAPAACAIEAGRIIGGRCGLAPKPLELLANLDLGLWQGKLVAEIRRQQPRTFRQWQADPWSVIPPEGELLEEARGRVELALERIFKRHRTGRVAVVVPPPLDALVRWLVSGEPLGDLWQHAGGRPALVELPVAAQWRAGATPPPPPPLAGTTPMPGADVGTR